MLGIYVTGSIAMGKVHFASLSIEQFTNKYQSTVVPVLKDHPIGHKNVVHQDRWSLVTGLLY